MTDFDALAADLRNQTVPDRPCGHPPAAGSDDNPRHPRPAGPRLEMLALYAVDYGVRADTGEMVAMDLRPFLDAVGARYDGCQPCFDYHCAVAGESSPLTVHVVGVTLLAFGINHAPASLLINKLDPQAAGIALLIRNVGLLKAAEFADELGPAGRAEVVGYAVNAMPAAVGWYDTPVSNHCPPVTHVRTDGLGDVELLADIVADEYLL